MSKINGVSDAERAAVGGSERSQVGGSEWSQVTGGVRLGLRPFSNPGCEFWLRENAEPRLKL